MPSSLIAPQNIGGKDLDPWTLTPLTLLVASRIYSGIKCAREARSMLS